MFWRELSRLTPASSGSSQRSHNPLRRFNSQTVREYNKQREKAGSKLRIAEQFWSG